MHRSKKTKEDPKEKKHFTKMRGLFYSERFRHGSVATAITVGVLVVLVLVNVWQYAGMTMIIYLAGLQNISQDLYEASMIDGAGT